MIIQVHYRNEIRIYENGICPTVSSAYGCGGGTIPLVMDDGKTNGTDNFGIESKSRNDNP